MEKERRKGRQKEMEGEEREGGNLCSVEWERWPWDYQSGLLTLKQGLGTFLVVQLRLHAPNTRDLGLIPDPGTRSHMLQLRILHAATKTWYSQMNK